MIGTSALFIAGLLQLSAYALFDKLLRGGALRGFFDRLPRATDDSFALASAGLCSALGWFWTWGTVSPTLRLCCAAVALLLAWNAATRDVDPVEDDPRMLVRLMLPIAAIASYFSPAGVLLTACLLSGVFRFWLHHATFPMRVLQMFIGYGAWWGVSGLWQVGAVDEGSWTSTWDVSRVSMVVDWATNESHFLVTLVVLQCSHYWISALAKAFLGPRWYSWVTDNRLHHLAASAYSWGWARFLPKRVWRKGLGLLRRTERPLQATAFGLELVAPIALVDARLAACLSLAFAAFHSGVFLVSGLLFWDWIVVDVLMALLLWTVPDAGVAFGSGALLYGLLVMGLFPLRHKLWEPMPLGWFDTPLTSRIHWQVIGKSGRAYGLYNDFMCPHERLYGRVNACFFVPHPVMTYHLGEVWKPQLRQAIIDAGPNARSLDDIRHRFGIFPHCAERQDRHVRYLQNFFVRLNRGERKHILPRWLRWLKAPGDQIFYWGDLPRYARQEPVAEVRLRFVEEYFDGAEHHRLTDIEVARFDIPDELPCEVVYETTPQELDDFLLGYAEGRLIDLPGNKKRYGKSLSQA